MDAQTRRVEFHNDSFYVHVEDSKIDSSGDIVHVGWKLAYNSGASRKGVIIKTDRYGNVIWSRTDRAGTHKRICIARNGDYLISEYDGFGVIRVTPAGVAKWRAFMYYTKSIAWPARDIAETDNGDIVVCGHSRFHNFPDYSRGVLMRLDSNGNRKYVKSYAIYPDYFSHVIFESIVADGHGVFIGGKYYTKGKSGQLLVKIDSVGNIIWEKILKEVNAVGYDDLFTFDRIVINKGHVYVSGSSGKNSSQDSIKHIFGRVDTIVNKFYGYKAEVSNYEQILNPDMILSDSAEYIIAHTAISLSNNGGRDYKNKAVFLSKLRNDTLLYTKKIPFDTAKYIRSINVQNDTVYLTGGAIDYWQPKGTFFSYLKGNSNTNNHCNISDSAINISAYNDTLIAPEPLYIYSDPTNFRHYTSNIIYTDSIFEHQLCGDTVCSSHKSTEISATPDTVACFGDTLQLLYSGRHSVNWYRDAALLSDTAYTLNVDTSGLYQLISTDYLQCKDTSNIISIIINPIPKPTITQYQDTIKVDQKYVKYQWLDKNGNAVPNVTSQSFILDSTDVYSVRVTDSNGCTGEADYKLYIPTDIRLIKETRTEIAIYPNPVSRDHILYIMVSPKSYNKVEVVDVYGRSIREANLNAGKNILDLQDISGGIYYLLFVNDGNNMIRKEKLIIY